ncbi:MAG: class I SAM-dependent methyltransferase [Acidobacteriota bacterium]
MTTSPSDGAEAASSPDVSLATPLNSSGVRASHWYYLHACPVCGSEDLVHYCRVKSCFSPGEFICYERCRGCGTVIRNPRLPDLARLDRYEHEELRPQQLEIVPKSQVHYAYMMRVINRYVSKSSGRRLFDFGCGSGGFLLEARKAGFEVMGLELSKYLAEHVIEEHEIPVFQGLITDDEFADERFDVIVSSQVFEHLLDPRQTLESVREHLNSSGLLLIEVPNLRAIQERLRRGATMDDSHLFYFTADSLSQMMESCGFKVLRVEEGLRPYRFGAARSAPDFVHAVGERVFSALQVKTGLSVLARLA